MKIKMLGNLWEMTAGEEYEVSDILGASLTGMGYAVAVDAPVVEEGN